MIAKVTRIAATFAGSVASAAIAQAQTAPPATEVAQPTNSAKQGADPADKGLGEIVVTAQRREQRLLDVPISVTAQTGAALKAAHFTDSQQLEQVSPALDFVHGYTPSVTALAIRGSGTLAGGNGLQPSVNVVIDGAPTVRSAEFVTDLTDIERVEILSGPQGTLFGKNATAGVVNIVTIRPNTQAFSGDIDLTGTEDGEAIAKAAVNAPLGQNAALRINGFYHYISPMIHNLTGPDLHKLRSYGAQAKLLVDLTDRTSLLFTGS